MEETKKQKSAREKVQFPATLPVCVSCAAESELRMVRPCTACSDVFTFENARVSCASSLSLSLAIFSKNHALQHQQKVACRHTIPHTQEKHSLLAHQSESIRKNHSLAHRVCALDQMLRYSSCCKATAVRHHPGACRRCNPQSRP